MPKMDECILSAIRKSVEKCGSQAALCQRSGISTSILSRYLKRQVQTINVGTWNILFPVIKEFLPEEYHRIFPTRDNDCGYAIIAQKNPEVYKELQAVADEFDIGKNLRADPMFGREKEVYCLCELIKTKLPYGRIGTLNKIYSLLLEDAAKVDQLEAQAIAAENKTSPEQS